MRRDCEFEFGFSFRVVGPHPRKHAMDVRTTNFSVRDSPPPPLLPNWRWGVRWVWGKGRLRGGGVGGDEAPVDVVEVREHVALQVGGVLRPRDGLEPGRRWEARRGGGG